MIVAPVTLRARRRLWLALLLLACAEVPSRAQDAVTEPATRTVVARRLMPGETIRVDGLLDERAWRDALPASAFAQREPDNGAPATEGTDVRILFDASRLIIGAEMFDQQADGVLANQMQRDGDFSADDRLIIALDTFLDRRNGYFFAVNPAGAMLDGLINPAATSDEFGAAINRSWDGIWTARVRRTARGWSAEIDIPFRTLNFDPSLTTWGINFQRTIRRRSEEVLWTAHDRSLGVTRMASAGRLEGLGGMSQGVGLDVKPYLVGNVAAAPGRGQPDAVATGDAGVDVLYNVTPALRATVSINTDFAETEVDQRQVNLTRFPLFFEEKRDFFLQGASYFDFARELGQQVTPFFSRRIGLDTRGLPQPIDVGAKLTGQAGAFDIGALYVRTRDTPTQPAADVAVARVRRRLLRQSYVGGLYTRRADQIPGGRDLHTAGVDFSLRTSGFRGSRTVDLSGWYVLTTNPRGTGGNIGRGLRLQYPNDPLYIDFSYRELQPNYDPAVGFLQRVGFRRFNPESRYTWHYRGPLIRSQQVRLDPEFVYDMDNRLLTRTIDVKPVTLVFNDGSTFELQVSPTYDRLERPFNISPGVTLPASAAYSFTRYQVAGATASRRVVSASGAFAFGDFYSGSRRQYVADVSLRPRRGVSVNLAAEHNVLDLIEGQFTTDVYRAVASTQFSPSLSLGNNLQYDSVSRSIGWQLRLRWIQRPGNDLFLVYTHNWQEFVAPAGRAFERLDNRLATKAVYTLRF